MNKTKTTTKKSFAWICAVMFAISFPLVAFSGCGQKTEVNLSIEDNIEFVLPGEEYNLIVSDEKGQEDGISIFILKGKENAEIQANNKLVLKSNAVPETEIVLVAEKNGTKSKELSLQIAHIEPSQVVLQADKNICYAGETIDLQATAYPTNSTRGIQYVVSHPQIAKVEDGKLIVSSYAVRDNTFSVVAKSGNIESQPISFTVAEYSDDEVMGIQFANKELSNSQINMDTSIGKTSLKLVAKLAVKQGEELVEIDRNDIIYEIENSEIATISNNIVSAHRNGSTKVFATYKNFKTSFVLNVLMRPNLMNLPTNYNKNNNYYFAVNQKVSNFNPDIIGDNGCLDYTLSIFENGQQIAKFEHSNDEIKVLQENFDITYKKEQEGNSLLFSKTGSFEAVFASLSGCEIERESAKFLFEINEGVNVYTKEDFISKMNDSSFKVVNLMNDLVFANGQESIRSVGDKTLNGNGFTIDLSKQKIGVDENGVLAEYPDSAFITMTTNNIYEDLNATIRDINMVGNFGMLSAEEISELTNESPEDLRTKKSGDYFKKLSYRTAIMLNIEGIKDAEKEEGKLYGVVYADIDNVSLTGFFSGMRVWHVVDKSAKTEQGKASFRNLNFSNMFGDGLAFNSSQARVQNFHCGTVGGSAIVENEARNSHKAGKTLDEDMIIKLGEGIDCQNIVDGTALYMYYEMSDNPTSKQLFEIANGLSGIVSVFTSTKISQLQAGIIRPDYGDKEGQKEYQAKLAQIRSSKTNIFKDIDGTNYFNVLCFQTSSDLPITYDKTIEDLFVLYNDELVLKGIDTTHKYIVFEVYNLLKSVPSFEGLAERLKDSIKGYRIIVGNYNYIEK